MEAGFHRPGQPAWPTPCGSEVDPLICPSCGGEMKIIALLDDGEVVAKILKQLNLWTEPEPDTARGSPESVIPDNIYEPFYDDLQLIPEERKS